MRDMTVGQLIQELQEYDEDTPVRLAVQPSYPLQHHLDTREPLRLVNRVLYVREGGQVYDHPYAPHRVFGDLDDERCANCGSPAIGDVTPPSTREPEPICRDCLEDEVPQEVRETFSPYP